MQITSDGITKHRPSCYRLNPGEQVKDFIDQEYLVREVATGARDYDS